MQNPTEARIESYLELDKIKDESASSSLTFSQDSFGKESLDNLKEVANEINALENGEEIKQGEDDLSDTEEEEIPDLVVNHDVICEPEL